MLRYLIYVDTIRFFAQYRVNELSAQFVCTAANTPNYGRKHGWSMHEDIAHKDLLNDARNAVNGPRMMADLAQLASWTKLAGTPDELESLKFVQGQMAAMGYKTQIFFHDAWISLPGKASLSIDGRDFRCITHSMAAATPPAGVQGEIVDLGSGGADDFAKVDVSGKILLVDGIASPAVAHRALSANVAGIIHLSPHEHIHEMCISPVWGNPSLETRANLPTFPVVTVCEADGVAIRDMLRGKTGSAHVTSEVDTGWRKTPLLVADLSAPDGSEPFVLFSGHHDTRYYGVMDNGSANVSMMEVARLCAERRREWKRGLRICFWSGHSQGRYSSSAWYADENFDELDRLCVAHVNIDSPGGKGATILSNTPVMTELHALAATAIRTETGQELDVKRKARAADESFPGIGIPSVFGALSGQEAVGSKMRNSLGWWWHTPDDLFDKIDEDYLARDTRILLEVVWRLLTDEILPIDQVAKIEDFLKHLREFSPALDGALPISGLIEATEALQASVTKLTKGTLGLTPSIINLTLMKLSRVLVPLDYTRGNRFSHEPALPSGACPILDSLRKARDCHQASDEFLFARVDARRTLNQVAHAIREAQSVVSAAQVGPINPISKI